MAKRLLRIAEEVARQSFIYYRHFLRGGRVLLAEGATGQQRHLESREVVGANVRLLDLHVLVGFLSVAGDGDVSSFSVIRQFRIGGRRYTTNSRQAPQCVEEPLVEGEGLSGFVTGQ